MSATTVAKKVGSEPTEKQIAFAKKLGIANPESYTKKQLSILIDQKKTETKTEKEVEFIKSPEVSEAVSEIKDLDISVRPNPWQLNVEKVIEVSISFASLNQMKREALEMQKKGMNKFIRNYNELVSFLKGLIQKGLAKKDLKEKVVKIYANKSPIYSFAYLTTILDNHFVQYSWR